MAFITAGRVRDTATTTGTGAFTVSGTAPTSYRTFSTVCATNDILPCFIAHQTLNEWEESVSTYSAANELTRTYVTGSSNAGAAVNFSAGTKDVVLGSTAHRLKGQWVSVNRNASDQTVSANVFTKVQFTTEAADEPGWFDSATNYRLTPTVPVRMLIAANVGCIGQTNDGAQAAIYKNGSSVFLGNYGTAATGSASDNYSHVSGVVSFNGTSDYAEIYVYSPNTTVRGALTSTYAHFIKVGD